METQIQIKINHKEKDKIKKAAEELGIGHSTFSRMAALEKATIVLKDIKQGDSC